MTKTFIVKVTSRCGKDISGSRIENAVAMSAPRWDMQWNTTCEEVVDAAKVSLDFSLYAVGKKSKGEWRLFDFFDSKKKAEKALQKSIEHTLTNFIKMELAILEFSPSMGVWRVVGKPVRV